MTVSWKRKINRTKLSLVKFIKDTTLLGFGALFEEGGDGGV
jgi:hypothetical protein